MAPIARPVATVIAAARTSSSASTCSSPARPYLLSMLFTLVFAAQAQAEPVRASRADPLDPKAAVPALRHDSALAKFRGTGDDKPMVWRDANDAVARIGGWRAYAREAHQPEPAGAAQPAAPAQEATPAPAPRPRPADAAGHKH